MAMEPSASRMPVAVRMQTRVDTDRAGHDESGTYADCGSDGTHGQGGGSRRSRTSPPGHARGTGVMVNVDWIIPVEYSEPTWIAARMTEMNAAASTPRIPALENLARVPGHSPPRPWVTGRLT